MDKKWVFILFFCLVEVQSGGITNIQTVIPAHRQLALDKVESGKKRVCSRILALEDELKKQLELKKEVMIRLKKAILLKKKILLEIKNSNSVLKKIER